MKHHPYDLGIAYFKKAIFMFMNTVTLISPVLLNEFLIMKIPHGNIAVTTTTETNLGIWADCQSVACWCITH